MVVIYFLRRFIVKVKINHCLSSIIYQYENYLKYLPNPTEENNVMQFYKPFYIANKLLHQTSHYYLHVHIITGDRQQLDVFKRT